LERLLYGPQIECDADRHGLDLCVSAGYDGIRCLDLLTSLNSGLCTLATSIWSTVQMWNPTMSSTRTPAGPPRRGFGRGRKRGAIFRFVTVGKC
jgi:hypothetical protein